MASSPESLGRHIFGPKAAPVRYQRIAMAANEGGGVVLARFFGRNIYLISDPHVARELHTTHESSLRRSYKDDPLFFMFHELFKTIVGDGVMVADGSEWLYHRKKLNPTLSDSAVRAYLPSLVTSYAHILDSWIKRSSSSPFSISRSEIVELVYSVHWKLVFGFSIGDSDVRSLTAIDHERYMLFGQIFSSPFGRIPRPDWLPFSRFNRLRRLTRDSDKFLQKALETYFERDKRSQSFSCLLDSFYVKSSNQSGCPLNFRKGNSIDFVKTIIYVSVTTTASSLEWALRILSAKPQIFEILRDEIDTFVSDDHSILTALPNLRKCTSFLFEVLRLYPTVPGVARFMPREVTYNGGTLSGGSAVITSIYGMHTNELYWEDPFSFRLDRFDHGASQNEAYWPFHMGGHICAGKKLAQSELLIALILIIRRFRIVFRPFISLEGRLIGVVLNSSGMDTVLLERRAQTPK